MDDVLLFELSCSGCRGPFYICRRDYRGQGYCSDDCRAVEQAALKRLANAKHQRSDEGRQDHAEHQRESATRKRAQVQALTDEGRKIIARDAEWVASDGPAALVVSDPVATARTDGDGLH